ncbi:Multiple epidermal growth factor-like domains protein 9 [Bagarius yarrelli]|uniref:Multiple epidermal growth factor-like domains protein 9 n=1 Tax=Bagarius yarrelli TaxID=175774 RepID=A0A556TIB3_BAGYA|nr:Multiple epidermal growth factor-like domains protein 9 [Bagarius yarrelli]
MRKAAEFPVKKEHFVSGILDFSVTAAETALSPQTAVTLSLAAVSVCAAIQDSVASSVPAVISETTQAAVSRANVTHPARWGCSVIGVCSNCTGNTSGSSCAECKPNYYRERGFRLTRWCLPCPCSTVTSSGSCTLNVTGQPVCDQCNPGYKGFTCEECQDGYYNADSICMPCECNGNAEPSGAPRICDPKSGVCLNCSYNTTGPQCQFCAPGFTGDALARNCTAIVPTTPVYYSTMTPSPNVTDQLPTSSPTILSWAQFNIIVLAIIITLILALLGAAGGIYTYRRYQNRKINAPFWTIELKEDNISFSSYHDSLTNADASGLLEDETCEAAANGQLTLNSPGSLYMPCRDL